MQTMQKSDRPSFFLQNQSHNTLIVIAVFVLLGLTGLSNLYSASNGAAVFYAQLKHLLIGAGIFVLFGWFIPVRLVNTYSYPVFVFVTISLVVVLILGHSAGGAQRWMSIGSIRFQPSEFAKMSVVLLVAKFIYNNKIRNFYTLKDLAPALGGILLIFALIFKQPDFGTAGVCLMIGCAQLAFVRIKIGFKTILLLFISAISTGIIGWFFLLERYQKLRILNLLDPEMDPSGSGYNSLQSLVAVGSGHLFGKGFMQGTQTQLQFLPARHTDFIFSVFAEEHGFWGSAFVFFLFAALSYVALEIARSAKDSFSSLVCLGIASLLFIEFTINVAMVLGIFPVVGIPLPFFSFGGSSLLTGCACLGLLIGIDRESAKAHKRQTLHHM